MYVSAYNASAQAVVIDNVGRTLGGGEFGSVAAETPSVLQAAEAGSLLLFPEGVATGPDASPAAVAADQLTETLNARLSAAEALSDEQLSKVLALEAVAMPRADMLALLVPLQTLDLPAPAPKKTTEKKKDAE